MIAGLRGGLALRFWGLEEGLGGNQREKGEGGE